MNQKHIHCDVIKAWADGADIQVLGADFSNKWVDVAQPVWDARFKYRVKPKPVAKWYRVALFKWGDGRYTFSVISNAERMEQFYGNHENFIRWVTDRQYVEIE